MRPTKWTPGSRGRPLRLVGSDRCASTEGTDDARRPGERSEDGEDGRGDCVSAAVDEQPHAERWHKEAGAEVGCEVRAEHLYCVVPRRHSKSVVCFWETLRTMPRARAPAPPGPWAAGVT